MKLEKSLAVTINGILILSALWSTPGSGADQIQDLGHINLGANKGFDLTLSLALKKEEELDRDLAEIYNPSSSNFHHFITPEEFKKRYALDEAEVARTVNYLEQHGFHSVVVAPNGFMISAVGANQSVQRTFNADIHQYKDSKGRLFFAPAAQIAIPRDLHVEAVYGLDNSVRLHPHYMSALPNPQPGDKPAVPGLSPHALRKAYNFPESLRGKDQVLALVEMDGYNPSDILEYENHYDLPKVPLKNTLLGVSGSAGYQAIEVVLDIEMMAAIAPDAKAINVYEGANSENGILQIFTKIASDNTAKAISTSWGTAEEHLSADFIKSESRLFKQMAMQGQAIFAAAGDNGANDNGSSLTVDDPAAQPYATGVGGTHLDVDQDGNYSGEKVWTSGGGGVSSLWPIPSYQVPLAKTFPKLSSTQRNVPDVSLVADIVPGFSMYYNSAWITEGGTSGAAPLWAAFEALVNERRQENNLSVLGFANPALYAVAEGPRYAFDFHDIKEGSNGGYPACEGPDNSSGLGTLNADELLRDLGKDRL